MSVMTQAAQPAQPVNPAAADQAAIAALDLEFQRAVKSNDAATIDRIRSRLIGESCQVALIEDWLGIVGWL